MFILAFRPISCLLGLSSLVLFCPPTASSDKIELTSDRPNRHDMGLKAKINYNILENFITEGLSKGFFSFRCLII